MDKNLLNKINTAEQEQQKARGRKKTKKTIQRLRPILLLLVVGAFGVLYIASVLLDFLGTNTAMTSKQANLGAVNFSTSATEETSSNRIIVDVNERNTDGAYELGYEFKDEDENVLDEIEALEKIKLDLLKENGDLDLNEFSNSELNIIGALMYNGLKVEQYNEEELKALVIFLKADIAGQSFDLRPKDQIGQAVTLNGLGDNDNVYGTLQVQRVKIEDANGVLGYKEELLEYIPYGDETTPETFSYMVKNNDASVLNNFTINENGELLYAKSSTTNITYSYSLNGASISIEEAQSIIPEENLGEEIHETNITASTPIDYKSRIKTYTASYGLLSDLLETTKNVDFCLELARVALNSKIVININEETTKKHQIQTQTYDQTTLLYDYVTYEISGTDSNTTTKTTEIARGNERPSESQNEELRKSGWNSSMTPTSSQGSSQGAILTYNWTHNGNNYTLVHTSNRTGNSWVLKREDRITTESSLPTDKADNELINIHNLTEPSLENEPYTAKEEITYTVKVETEETYNSCKIEIGKVDCWSIKYEKKYNTPVAEPVTIPENYETTGEFSEISEGIEVPKSEIENDPHVQEFRNNRIQKYKSEHGADNVTIDFTGLTIKQRVKTNVSVKFDAIGPNIIYKFGEEDVDTTEVNWKNVIYINNKKEYTSYIEENGVEVPEIGFLYIYDKYITAGIDLYLQDDAENKLFELLESDPQTANSANIIRYLLFVYDGIDRGVTEFDLSIYKPSEFRSGAYGSGDIPLYTPLVTRDEFLTAMQEFSESGAKGNKKSFDKYFLSRADEIYTLGEKYQINPELIVVFAWKEQSFGSPVEDESNFWGLKVPNGQTKAPSFGSFEGGVKELAKLFHDYNAGSGTWQEELIKKRYDERREYNPNGCGLPGTLKGLMSIYTCWLSEDRNYHEEGNSGIGGRYYLKVTYGDEYQAKCGSVHRDGEPYTIQEFADTAACAYEQVLDKWTAIFGNYATISITSGGITTQEEADALTEYYNEMLNTVVHYKNEYMQRGPFPKYWSYPYSGLEPFQCTWWANGRACMYLEEYGTKYTKYPTQMGHGKHYYGKNVEGGWFNYGDEPRPNSIVSWSTGEYGHVAYVEGVTEEGIWISHAGGAESWFRSYFLKRWNV